MDSNFVLSPRTKVTDFRRVFLNLRARSMRWRRLMELRHCVWRISIAEVRFGYEVISQAIDFMRFETQSYVKRNFNHRDHAVAFREFLRQVSV